MSCTILCGGFWGDEGKGKVVAYLSSTDKPDAAVRTGVGPNAEHGFIFEGKRYDLRQITCAFVCETAKLFIGAGVLVNPEIFLKEIEKTKTQKRIWIDRQCGIIEKRHIKAEHSSEHFTGKIKTMGMGCGPANADRANRILKIAEDIDELEPFLTNVSDELNDVLEGGGSVLIEGSQGCSLSLLHGTYPYVTSKDTTACTLAADAGIGPLKVNDVVVAFKSYVTRASPGPLANEYSFEEIKQLGLEEAETAIVYERPGGIRRVGRFDFEIAKRALRINSATQIALTCIDKLYPECRGIKSYEELSTQAKDFISDIETKLEVPVTLISTGPATHETIDMRETKL
ncbi:MAG: adenylosuccinate synthetase [Candidatus Bathyarchaeota archaeon]|nr:adenylosuccinate synthetase [Candidatus Bathyarchaeota archaeon]MDH5712853.1 adenylosuccinate synthetase [Candidatus Bathyarchaeota archaeon]